MKNSPTLRNLCKNQQRKYPYSSRNWNWMYLSIRIPWLHSKEESLIPLQMHPFSESCVGDHIYFRELLICTHQFLLSWFNKEKKINFLNSCVYFLYWPSMHASFHRNRFWFLWQWAYSNILQNVNWGKISLSVTGKKLKQSIW